MCEGCDAYRPGTSNVGVLWESVGKLEGDHAVGERPRSPSPLVIARERCEDHRTGALLGRDRRRILREGATVHERIQVWALARPPPIGARDDGNRVATFSESSIEGISEVSKPIGDERDLELALVGDVLVQRRSLDSELSGDSAHREPCRSLPLQEFTGDLHDLISTIRIGD